jgi:hypothetical protein
MAEAVAFLISAHAILEDLSNENFHDPRAARLVASVCGKVFGALSTLDDFSVTQWIKSGSAAGIGCSSAPLPTWGQFSNGFGVVRSAPRGSVPGYRPESELPFCGR